MNKFSEGLRLSGPRESRSEPGPGPSTHAALLINLFPSTAALHNIFFWRPTCMLRPFGLDYDLHTIGAWLAGDPSPRWALLLNGAVYLLGRRMLFIQTLSAPISIAFLPLSGWIWDIPFSDRAICRHFHDLRLTVGAYPVHSRHVYLLGLLLYFVLLSLIVRSRGGFSLRAPPTHPSGADILKR